MSKTVAVKHVYQDKEFRGEWPEDQCRLTLRYEGTEGTVERTGVVGDGTFFSARGTDKPTGGLSGLSTSTSADSLVDWLCGQLLHDYRDKYKLLDKKESCELLSKWAEQNPD